MKLIYHEGKNFGDAINPIIFEKLLPDFFSDDTEYLFLGIGSIIGLKRPLPNTKKVIVFSSGFGGGDTSTYGSLPSKQDLEKYDFRCVRGPLTAEALELPTNTSVCDGAILLPEVIPNNRSKKIKYSYMPHVGSLVFYSQWGNLLDSIDIKLIDPAKDVNLIIEEIQETEILLTEAMHGAIIAEAYRIPWIPVKSNKTINEFKWKDFCLSLNMEYKPNMAKTLFDESFLEGIFEQKLLPLKSKIMNQFLAKGYGIFQHLIREKEVIREFEKIKNAEVFLSSDSLLDSKKEILLNKLFEISNDYKNTI